MFKAILFSFTLGVVFSQDVTRLAQDAAIGAMQELRTALNLDAYEKISAALS
jgi:hypothetical protein